MRRCATLPLIRRDSLMDIRSSRYNELGSGWTRKLRRSNAGRKKKEATIKTGSGAAGYCMSLSLEFWRIAEFNSRAHCGISRGERSEKSRNRRATDSKKKRKRKKKSGYKNLSSSLANGTDTTDDIPRAKIYWKLLYGSVACDMFTI